ncbi:MAG: hypothetical protein JO352_04290 [Chloroflexi bacterium]|nr:hypothetical protein [Chloroflexota bacterium]
MYYLRDPAPYKARAREGRKRAHEHNIGRVRALLRSSACADCGTNDFAVLEFDHREPANKSSNVGELLTGSWTVVAGEIAKCDIVCANCHRKRTARHYGWRRLLGLESLALPELPRRGERDYERINSNRSCLARRHRNRAYVYQYLRDHPCVLCGEADPVALDFDHQAQGARSHCHRCFWWLA